MSAFSDPPSDPRDPRAPGDPGALGFPFRVGTDGPAAAGRLGRVRHRILSVLFTNPGERAFRPEFGAGVEALVFEPNASALREVTRKRLTASLRSALEGEVDPRTLEVTVEGEAETLTVTVRYVLAAVGREERHVFAVGGGAGGGHG
ncbi:MAG: GPW/gp25 family protein [Acidobacteriota bacterium]